MKEERESWDQCQKKEKSYWITALTRTLTGHVCKKTGKCVFSFKGRLRELSESFGDFYRGVLF